MKKVAFGPALVLALLAGLALPAAAQMPDVPMGKWWKRPRVVDTLALSAEQQDRLEEVFSKNRRTFIDLKADLEKRQLDLEELLTKKGTDPKKISDATDALEAARGRLGKARTMMIVEMKGILTDDQWKKLLDAREQWRKDVGDDRRGWRGGQNPQNRRAPGGPYPEAPLKTPPPG